MESEESSLEDNYLDDYSTEIDSRAYNSEEDSQSQDSVEDEKIMANFEKKIRHFSKQQKTEQGSDCSEASESEIPEDAKQLMKKMRKRIRAISSNFPLHTKGGHTTNFESNANFNLQWFDDPKVSPIEKTSTAKKVVSPTKKKMAPFKEETSFQKADRSSEIEPIQESDGRPLEDKSWNTVLPQPPLSEISFREVEKDSPKIQGPPDPGKVPRAVLEINSDQDFDANLKVIKYLEQLQKAEKEIDRRIQLKEEVSASEIDAINLSRNAILNEYGYDFVDETENPVGLSSNDSDNEDEDAPMKEEIVRRILRATLGKKASDVDLTEIIRSEKWKKAVEKEKSSSNVEVVEGRLERRRRQFDKLFDGAQRPFSVEDLQKIHDNVGPWVHNQNRKLDKFMEAKKYTPGYLLNEWDGRLSDGSDEPDIMKYRENQQNFHEASEEENPESTIPPGSAEERIPTLQDNNGFLFPTPLTKAFGKNEAFVRGNNAMPNPKAVVESVANEVKRKKDAEKCKQFLKDHWQPPYAFSNSPDNREMQQD